MHNYLKKESSLLQFAISHQVASFSQPQALPCPVGRPYVTACASGSYVAGRQIHGRFEHSLSIEN